jgi:YidC/Oxa1 family membrane protein insertase
MEKRILMAFALSFLVFTLYLRFFSPPPRQPVEPPDGTGGRVEDIQPPTEIPPPPTAPAPQASVEPPEAEPPTGEVRHDTMERTIEVDTPLYHAVLVNRGARLKSFVLKTYTDEAGNPFEMVPIEASEALGIHPLSLELQDPAVTAEVANALFEASRPSISLRPGETGELSFHWADGRGIEVRKKIGFSGDTYRLAVEVSARRAGAELSKVVIYGPGVGEESREGTYVQPDKGVIQAAGQLEFFSAGDIEDNEGAAVGVSLVGVSAHYFAGLIVPSESGRYAARLSQETLELAGGEGEKPQRRVFITAGLEAPNAPLDCTFYVGPKEQDRLAELGPGIQNVVDYGSWMKHLALPLRSALLWIHGYIGNFGWSIVFLTIGINVVLIPLKHHSYVSMRKMQKLAPQVKRIQERYKKLKPTDPRRQDMNKEVMGIYKENNVSPLSGCLPMVLMIPFFFAFYRLLMVSIELRHAPFILWIQDLSTFDPFFVLPILMGGSQIAIQKMSPQTSADPVQAKIMSFMPVVFVFILAWAPSGLVLYWFVNNLVSLGQQTVTNRMLSGGEQEAASSSGGGGGKKKKKKKGNGPGRGGR